MWYLPGPGIKPMPLALQGGFLTPGLPGKPRFMKLLVKNSTDILIVFFLNFIF